MGLTQHQKIIGGLCQQDKWFYPYDFMPPRRDFSDPYCVGYEATARMAELRNKYPEMIETKPDGKYKCSRLKRATIREWFPQLPKDLRQIVAKELDYYPHIPGNRYGQTFEPEIPKTATLQGFPGIPDGTEVNIKPPEQGSLL